MKNEDLQSVWKSMMLRTGVYDTDCCPKSFNTTLDSDSNSDTIHHREQPQDFEIDKGMVHLEHGLDDL